MVNPLQKTEVTGATRISLAIFFGLILQGGGIIWWASGLNQRVEFLETWKVQQDHVLERVAGVEARMDNLKEQGNRIEETLKDMNKKGDK